MCRASGLRRARGIELVLCGVGKLFWRLIHFKCTLKSPADGWKMSGRQHGKRTSSCLQRSQNAAPETIKKNKALIGVIAAPCVSVMPHRAN